ncbi:MAG: hypothetical protein RL632_2196 [Bacteroidota bacterium]|jgi:hypothetical protein
MRIFLVSVLAIISSTAYSQLDEKYHGYYLSDKGNAEIAIYTIPEMVEDCFFADYRVYAPVNENNESAHEDDIYSGFGSCVGPNGHWLINLESNGRKLTLEVSFSMNGKNPVLTLYKGKEKTTFSYLMPITDDVSAEDVENSDALYLLPNMEVEDNEYPLFKRADGALLYVMTDADGISFIISAGTPNWEPNSEEDEDPCFYNVHTGTMIPQNKEMTLYSFLDTETGCNIQFKFLNDAQGQRFEVQESKCTEEHINGCPSWNGTYAISPGE